MSKDFDELIRDLDLIIENVNSLRTATPSPASEDQHCTINGYDSFCENIALKLVLKVLLSSVDKIVKIQITNKMEQEIAQLEQQIVRIGGGPVSEEDLAQMISYVRKTVTHLCE